MNPQNDQLNRFISFAEANYEINSWLKATARYGLDNYTDVRKGAWSRGTSGIATGTINDVNFYRRDNNLDVLLLSQHRLSNDLDRDSDPACGRCRRDFGRSVVAGNWCSVDQTKVVGVR